MGLLDVADRLAWRFAQIGIDRDRWKPAQFDNALCWFRFWPRPEAMPMGSPDVRSYVVEMLWRVRGATRSLELPFKIESSLPNGIAVCLEESAIWPRSSLSKRLCLAWRTAFACCVFDVRSLAAQIEQQAQERRKGFGLSFCVKPDVKEAVDCFVAHLPALRIFQSFIDGGFDPVLQRGPLR